MKQENEKTRKQRQQAIVNSARNSCGTLSYLAECRGMKVKNESMRAAPPPDYTGNITRK